MVNKVLGNNIDKVEKYLKDNFDENLEQIREFLRHPSVSYTGEGIKETAERIKGMIEELDGKADVVPTEGHPIVFGRLDQGAEKTVMVYGMYDVMPADEPDWSVDPWAAEIKELPKLGKSIVARGAVNTKGPLAAFFRAIEGYKKTAGKLPVNLVFAIEGEEEMGSRHFVPFVEDNLKKLEDVDVVLFPFFSQNEKGIPYMTLGTKGILYFELEVQGGKWGAPTERGIHGSYNAWVKNPIWRLIQAVSTFTDKDENVQIEGFFDNVDSLPEEELQLIKSQIESGLMNEETFMEYNGVEKFKDGIRGLPLWERLFSKPQFNIDGIAGGYTGEGTKTLLPHKATIKMDVRTVPSMDPDRIVDLIRGHLDKNGYSDIKMNVLNKYYWSKLSLEEDSVQAMLKAYKDMDKEAIVWPVNPGSAPYYVFERIMGVPYVTGGLGHGSRQHSNDEYCTVDGLLDFEISIAHWLNNYAKMTSS
jgi:acetylornithine deacetylase/succinyl-diaminopimelate desuccinylase-like protein